MYFTGDERKVEIEGEAYFEVAEGSEKEIYRPQQWNGNGSAGYTL